MFDWIAGVIESWGYPGLFVLTIIENVFPPIPSELIMPFGGYLAAQGKMNFWIAGLVGGLGSAIGSMPLFFLGRWLGEARVRSLIVRWGHWVALDEGDMDHAQAWFARYRGLAVFLARVLPGVRGFIGIPAAINGMPAPHFFVATLAGTTVWAFFLVTAGYYLGPAFSEIDRALGSASKMVLGGLVMWFVWRGWAKSRAKRRSSHASTLPRA